MGVLCPATGQGGFIYPSALPENRTGGFIYLRAFPNMLRVHSALNERVVRTEAERSAANWPSTGINSSGRST
jgi:hypothetical protein